MNDVTQKSVMQKISFLFASRKLAVLSTSGKNGPYASLISFAEADQLKSIIFATPRDTVKFTNIKEDNRIALLIENSSNSIDDFDNAMAVTATGRAVELDGETRSRMVEKLLRKHPNLEAFVHSGNCAVMQMDVAAFVLVEKFQEVTRVEI